MQSHQRQKHKDKWIISHSLNVFPIFLYKYYKKIKFINTSQIRKSIVYIFKLRKNYRVHL